MNEELQTALDAATVFTQTAALMIANMLAETRGVAYLMSRYKLGEAISSELGDTNFGREWVRSQLRDIRALVAKIDASGGSAGGRA
jgi:hypothetical protein